MAILFISRGTVSGVKVLVSHLCERTGVSCLCREDLIKQVSRYGDWATTVTEEISRAASAYDHFSRIRRPYIVLMRRALLEKIQNDNVLYDGFSGHLLVPRLGHFVRVRIIAPLDLRVSMTMERLKCDEEYARQYIHDSDNNQVRWARFMYGHDIRDPALYDLNINLGHMTLNTIGGILEQVLMEKDLQASDGLKAQVEQLLLAANIEAALVVDPRTRELEIDCHIENGCIHLDGPYLKDDDLETVKRIARNADDSRDIEYTPGYADQHWLEELTDGYKTGYLSERRVDYGRVQVKQAG
jgi:two-component system response regulator CpxR